MTIYEGLEQELQEALSHLYDPDYQPSESFCTLTGCDSRDGAFGVQSAILRVVKELEPPPDTVSSARAKSFYELVHCRFVLKLTQEATAQRLHMSVGTAWRVQREAIHTLARLLWEHSLRRGQAATSAQAHGGEHPREMALGAQALDWRSQVARELAWLEASDPNAVVTVADAINDVVELGDVLTLGRNVRVEVHFMQPNLVAAVHPALLRQALTAAIRRLGRYVPCGPISIFAGLEDGNPKITLTGLTQAENRPAPSDLTRDIVTSEDLSLEAHVEGDHAYVWIDLPSLGKITVLAVDDNSDMADFYRRCTEGTSYHIVHVAAGQDLFEAIKVYEPDIIVLDVMLPDVDGWTLLMRLHQNPVSRSIPVVVCSVVRDEELALSLGAALYVAKPVRPREFVEALDRVRPQAPTEATRARAHLGTAC